MRAGLYHKNTLFIRLLTVAVCMLCCLVARAQNNPYKIDDRLYALYAKAYNIRVKEESLPIADEMYCKAVAIGDRKAQYMALVIPMLHYLRRRYEQKFEEAVRKLQAKAYEYGYEQYYYYAMTTRANFLANTGRTFEAYRYLADMETFARKHNHLYGIFAGLDALGQIHFTRSEPGLAIKCYEEAIEIGTQYLPDQDMGSMYRRVAECYEETFDYAHMLEVAVKGYPLCKTKTSRKRILRTAACASFGIARRDLFRKYYDMYCKVNGGEPSADSKLYEDIEVAILHMLDKGEYDKAGENIPKTFAYFTQRYGRLCELMYLCAGEWKNLSLQLGNYYPKRIAMTDSLHTAGDSEMDAHFINMGIEYDNRRLSSEHQRMLNEQQAAEIANANLKLSNTQLSLRNSSLELGRIQSQADIMRYSVLKKQLEAERLREEVKARKALNAELHTWIVAAFVAVVVLVAVGCLYIVKRRRVMKRLYVINSSLESNNLQLKAECEKAEAANNVKTVVLQNLDSSIRTPLANIAECSRHMAANNRLMSAEEMKNVSRKIQENTSLLLALVGKTLEKGLGKE